MKTLSTNELITYLKNAAELEASVFTQQQVLANAEKTLTAKEPVYRTVSRKHPDKPKEPVYKFGNEDLEKKAFRISIITSVVISAAGILCFLINGNYLDLYCWRGSLLWRSCCSGESRSKRDQPDRNRECAEQTGI